MKVVLAKDQLSRLRDLVIAERVRISDPVLFNEEDDWFLINIIADLHDLAKTAPPTYRKQVGG